jgi:propanol-preferring alcohol dehydrogenase
MRAMVFKGIGQPLVLEERPIPAPHPGQLLIEVSACAVCRTDLHIIDGELKYPKLPLVLGHEIIGRVVAGTGLPVDTRVGVPWLGYSCSVCEYCTSDRENLCEQAKFTGYQLDGGYAEFTLADHRYCFPVPEGYDDLHAAPLMCAGLIGYRCLKLVGAAQRLGLFGFGASAHLLTQIAHLQGRRVFVFTRPQDHKTQAFAKELGAVWAGGADEEPPQPLDAAIIFAPTGALVPVALKLIARGGKVISAGIHMSEIPAFAYALLWGERSIHSVANLTRQDAHEFLTLASEIPLRVEIQPFPLEAANEALEALRRGQLRGAAVLKIR